MELELEAGDADACAVVSRVNAGVRSVDDVAFGDDRDDLVEQINLHGNEVETMDGLETFTRVVELCLSSNCIEEVSFHALEPLVNLRVLDLSANSIDSTLGFPQLPCLEELSLAHNRLTRLDGMTRPVKFPRLRYLDLRGNEFEEFSGLAPLQRLKRLSQLRLQNQDGSQANPVCDIDDYQHVMIKLLPHIKYLDEEEVELLKEVGNVPMPKYQSIFRKIATSNRRGDANSIAGSPSKSELSPSLLTAQGSHSVARHRGFVNVNRVTGTSSPLGRQNRVETTDRAAQTTPVTIKSPVIGVSVATSPQTPKGMDVVKVDSTTNTDADPAELTFAQRERILSERESAFAAAEKEFLVKENHLTDRQNDLEAQVTALKTELETASARADKAEASLAKLTDQLRMKEHKQKAAQEAFDNELRQIKNALTSKEDEWLRKISALNIEHTEALSVLERSKQAAEKLLATANAEVAKLTGTVQAQATELAASNSNRTKNEELIASLRMEIERRQLDNSSVSQQLSQEATSHKERTEEIQRRSKELEKQVTELQTNLEAVYNKCIEKDEDIHQLKRSLLAKQSEVEEIKAQHAKSMDRQDKIIQQQQDLYDKQLQASILQIEMEFRREHQLTVQQIQGLQHRYDEVVKEARRYKDAYSQSRKREAGARAEIQKIQAILADDKQKLYAEDIKRADNFERKLREAEDRCLELERSVENLRIDNKQIAELSGKLNESKAREDALRSEIAAFDEQKEAWQKLEDDLRAAIKVKDVMLNDQQRQINEIRQERDELESRFNDEMAEMQAQLDDLEAGLDDSAQRAMDEEAKCTALQSEKQVLERKIASLSEQLDEQNGALEQKSTALDFIEREMEKMRAALTNQDELFRKRLQKHMEQNGEEIERARAAAEEERERLRIEWEAERDEIMSKQRSLASDLQIVASQNTKLRAAIEIERKKNAQNDHDMRVLLAQIDRERHMKQEHLRQIKSLFEQLQRDAP